MDLNQLKSQNLRQKNVIKLLNEAICNESSKKMFYNEIQKHENGDLLSAKINEYIQIKKQKEEN